MDIKKYCNDHKVMHNMSNVLTVDYLESQDMQFCYLHKYAA